MAAERGILLERRMKKKILWGLQESTEKPSAGLLCYCDSPLCYNHEQNNTCRAKPGAGCFVGVEEIRNSDDQLEPEWSYGCLPPEESRIMVCKANLVPHKAPIYIECCNEHDFCNKGLRPMYEKTPEPVDTGYSSKLLEYDNNVNLVAMLCSGAVGIIFLLVLIFWVMKRFRKRENRQQMQYLRATAHGYDPYYPSGRCLKDLVDESSGSGSGIPMLVQRTIARQLTMVHVVGKGRYGEVWLAKWRGEAVAVKVFFTTEEESWLRETEIYQTVLLRNENILGFIASDIKGTGTWTQMLLVTDFHENGSLYDYLQVNTVEPQLMLKMIISIASGLSHLHKEVYGTMGKPAMAHRDIKSRNILVMKNLQCCIADFGLAIKYNEEEKKIDFGTNTRVGTRRYMAPEVLDESLNKTVFENFKTADIYSFALVTWEIARRCVTGDKMLNVDPYELPYQHYVPQDPSFEDMYAVVCEKNIRPPIPQRWNEEDCLQQVSKVIQECWHANPAVRLSALRVKKSLMKLITDNTIKLV